MIQTLRAYDLVKSYKGRRVVNKFSFNMTNREIVGLLGPNGAGKTTIFYMIIGLTRGDSGTVFMDDMELTYMPMYQRARVGIGYLPQEPSVFRKLTVYENVLAILETLPYTRYERETKAKQLLDELGILELSKNVALSLSGGERRRLEIARALATEPSFILLDEPFAGIDPIAVKEIQGIIEQLKSRNIGILITDHNVRDTLGITSRAYIVSEGRLLEEGSPEHIASSEKARNIYLGDDFSLE